RSFDAPCLVKVTINLAGPGGGPCASEGHDVREHRWRPPVRRAKPALNPAKQAKWHGAHRRAVPARCNFQNFAQFISPLSVAASKPPCIPARFSFVVNSRGAG